MELVGLFVLIAFVAPLVILVTLLISFILDEPDPIKGDFYYQESNIKNFFRKGKRKS